MGAQGTESGGGLAEKTKREPSCMDGQLDWARVMTDPAQQTKGTGLTARARNRGRGGRGYGNVVWVTGPSMKGLKSMLTDAD